jgi:adenylate cyclase
MALEIERRFLVAGDAWRAQGTGFWLKQGYISVEPARTVRVRVRGDMAWLTLKSGISATTRHEFEYPVPVADAEAMLATMCPFVVEKRRTPIRCDGVLWEVDEFFGANAGLVLAEIELPHPDTPFVRPGWLAAEVTDDMRFTNSHLSQYPYTTWK